MSEELTKDLEELKKDMIKFRDHLGETINHVGSYSQEMMQEKRKRLQDSMRAFGGMASEKAEHVKGMAKEQAGKSVEYSRQTITHRPLTSVATSFAVGMLAALFMHKGKK